MRIRDGDNYLSIEPCDEGDPHSGFSITARCRNGDSAFSGSNDTVHFDRTDKAKKSFEEFAALKRSETRVDLTEGCYLTLARLSRGDIQVDFEIHVWSLHSSMKGRVVVAGENSTTLLDELGRMAYGSTVQT